jgi:phospholipid/cholesterol/gamma-HCH transport system substrate-binding protein
VARSKWKVAATLGGGCLLLAALGIVLIRVKDLTPGYVSLRAYLDDAGGLVDGTQVRLDGVPVGYLDSLRNTNSPDLKRKIVIGLKVKRRFLREIPADSEVGVSSDNLLGGTYIGIHRGHNLQPIAAGAELRPVQSQDMTVLMARAGQAMDRLQNVADRANALLASVGKGKGAIGRIVQDPRLQPGGNANAEFDRLMADIQHGHGTLTKLLYEDPLDRQLASPLKRLKEIGTSMDATTARIDALKSEADNAKAEFDKLQLEARTGNGSLAHLDRIVTRFDDLTARFEALERGIEEGRGTIGQFTVNPTLGESLDAATRELQEFGKGLKKNPRKYFAVRLF